MRYGCTSLICIFLLVLGCGGEEPAPDDVDPPRTWEGDVGTAPPSEEDVADDDTVEEEESYLAEHCLDGELNGDETDVDCGGSCFPCEAGQKCEVRTDCKSLHCDQEEFVCIEPECPNDCSLLGACHDGLCTCQPGWSGPDCSQPTCIDDCSDNGVCEDGICKCDEGWTGLDCSVEDS